MRWLNWVAVPVAALIVGCGGERSTSSGGAAGQATAGTESQTAGAGAAPGSAGAVATGGHTAAEGGGAAEGGSAGEPSGPVNVTVPQSLTDEFEQLSAQLAADARLTSAELLSQHQVSHEALAHAPLASTNLDLIQASALGLNDAELAVLAENGLVMSDRLSFPSFVYGYTSIYAADLPVYISADSLLDALHRSYDVILKRAELLVLYDQLVGLLDTLRSRLAAAPEQPGLADLDTYLGVARALVTGKVTSPVAGGDGALMQGFIQSIEEASGTSVVTLFGVERREDFSQFKPRGHYTEAPELTRYFRAMMWLGRVDFRLIETSGDGGTRFNRLQYDAMLTLHELADDVVKSHFHTLDTVIGAFVGESDYMTLPQVESLVTDLGGLDAARGASDEQVASAIVAGNYGFQRIASHLIAKEPSAPDTLPLNRSFALLGQRYVVDSHVFSSVVWDRTEAKRMMPDPLDIAFAALGNDSAAALLTSELETYAYAGNLKSMRRLVDAHGDDYWDKNLYNAWLSAVRGLSARDAAQPAIARTEPWSRRVLGAQLASWAQLRHDTLLYAKQSYTTDESCEFPDAYVDPYPDVYAAMRRFAEVGGGIVDAIQAQPSDGPLGPLSVFETALAAYFSRLASVAEMLEDMAQRQLTGMPHTDEQLAFVNQAVSYSLGCGAPSSMGWYAKLFFESGAGVPFDPTIADVHTQPTLPGGAEVGRVLHVGTGGPRLMLVTVDTCSGPRAYVGLASSYHQLVTEDYRRLTDREWSADLEGGAAPATVPWLGDLVVE